MVGCGITSKKSAGEDFLFADFNSTDDLFRGGHGRVLELDIAKALKL